MKTLRLYIEGNIEELIPPPGVEPVKPRAIMDSDKPQNERDWLQTEFEEALKTWRKRPQWVRKTLITRQTVEWCRYTIFGDISQDEPYIYTLFDVTLNKCIH